MLDRSAVDNFRYPIEQNGNGPAYSTGELLNDTSHEKIHRNSKSLIGVVSYDELDHVPPGAPTHTCK